MRRLALPVLVLPLAACGGSADKAAAPPSAGNPAAVVKRAAVKTAGAPSEHLVVTGTATVGGTSVAIDGSGDFDNRSHLGAVHATIGAVGIGGAIDEVVDGTTIYIRSPLLAGSLPPGKTWIKLDVQTFGKAHGIDLSALVGESPTQSLTRLETAHDVTRIGEETVDGVATTHYRARVDLRKLPQGAKVQALTHATYGPVDVWIGNADGYVHRYRLTFTASGNGRSVATATTFDFSKYGEAVSVNVPPASATVDGTSATFRGLTS